MSDLKLCIRCNGSGRIWARPNRDGDLVPLDEWSNIGIGAFGFKDSPFGWTSSDQTIPCDWCGGARVVHVTPASKEEARVMIEQEMEE
jgi:hypothetical protein